MLVQDKIKSKDYYDKDAEPVTYKVGHKVLLNDETVRRGRSRKLSPQYIGPYEVTAVNGVNTTKRSGRRTAKSGQLSQEGD
jgi:hypothetical protein